jgi:hypothetical protein
VRGTSAWFRPPRRGSSRSPEDLQSRHGLDAGRTRTGGSSSSAEAIAPSRPRSASPSSPATTSALLPKEAFFRLRGRNEQRLEGAREHVSRPPRSRVTSIRQARSSSRSATVQARGGRSRTTTSSCSPAASPIELERWAFVRPEAAAGRGSDRRAGPGLVRALDSASPRSRAPSAVANADYYGCLRSSGRCTRSTSGSGRASSLALGIVPAGSSSRTSPPAPRERRICPRWLCRAG